MHYQGPVDRGDLIALGAHHCGLKIEDTLRLALWGYTLYRSFNLLRSNNRQHSGEVNLGGIFEGYLREAVSGHPRGSAFITHCWNARYRFEGVRNDSVVQT